MLLFAWLVVDSDGTFEYLYNVRILSLSLSLSLYIYMFLDSDDIFLFLFFIELLEGEVLIQCKEATRLGKHLVNELLIQ